MKLKLRLLVITLILLSPIVIYSGIVLSQSDITNETQEQIETQIPKIDLTVPKYKVVSIVDGDTVYLSMNGKNVYVRLKSIDTPETVHPNKPQGYYGWESTMFITNLLKGEEVYTEIEPEDEVDMYSRKLFYLYRASDGLFVNLEIVRQGYGSFESSFPCKYADLFSYYEEKAKNLKKGIWSSERDFVYVTKTDDKYHIYRCKHLDIKCLTKDEAIAEGYKKCSFCAAGE